VDVRDEDAVHQVVKEIYTDHGRIDGVVYAAGVIEDRLIADKDPESLPQGLRHQGGRRAGPARHDRHAADGTRFVTLFGSIAATLATVVRSTTRPRTTRCRRWVDVVGQDRGTGH